GLSRDNKLACLNFIRELIALEKQYFDVSISQHCFPKASPKWRMRARCSNFFFLSKRERNALAANLHKSERVSLSALGVMLRLELALNFESLPACNWVWLALIRRSCFGAIC